jgi:hypothetical protein
MKKLITLILIMVIVGVGTGLYLYQQHQSRQAEKAFYAVPKVKSGDPSLHF